MKRLLLPLALTLAVVSPVAAKAQAAITGPDGARFGESAGVTFDLGKVNVRTAPGFTADHYVWAIAECRRNASTVTADWDPAIGEPVYREYLHLGDQSGFPINDNLMTFGPTPSWSAGGADCSVDLIVYDGNGSFSKPYASDAFEVLP